MAKNSIRDYDATAANNTDVQSTDISEGCSPAGINNAIREVMADIKDVSTGTVSLETPAADRLDVDNLRLDGNTISSTDTNGDITIDPDGTGDTIIASGNVILNNAEYLQFKDSGGTARDVLAIDAFNGLNINSAGGGSAAPIVFKENGSEVARFDSSGNLLIATNGSAPSSSVAGWRLSDPTVTAPTVSTGSGTGATSALTFQNGNGVVGQIYTSGSSTTYVTSSDYRLKENAVDMTGAITRVKSLQPKRFNFIADDSTTVDGFMAHEAATVVPEAVSGTHNEVDDDGNAVMQGIDQSKLVPLLVGALKEAIAKIETLETKVTALENA